MLNYLKTLFSTEFMPHGFCLGWHSEVIWVHVISDALITLAYLCIPLFLVSVVRKRKDLPFDWMFLAFGTFILACGATHAMSILTLWKPIYRLEGVIKAVTAIASIVTAYLLKRLVPLLVQLPSFAELQECNRVLEEQIEVRTAVEKELQISRDELSNANLLLARTIQEERHVSDLLREREQQVSLSFDAARIGTWRWNFASGEMIADRQMKQLYGLAPDDPIATIDSFYTMIHADDLEKVQASLDSAMLGHGLYNTEFRVKCPDGSLHWIVARGAIVLGDNGEAAGMIGINMDVDSCKTAELALQETQRQFETLADSIPQLAWMANPDGFIFWYNARWFAYTGTTAEQMEGWGWQSVHDPQELPRVMERWQASLASRQPFSMEMPLRRKDGSFRWFLTRVIPVLDSEGNVVRWFGTSTDVTEIRQVREALRESEQQFRQLADTMPQFVCVTRPDGYVEWWNQRAYAYSGMTLEEAGGYGWACAIHPDDQESTGRTWLRSLSTGDLYESEYRWRRNDGVYRWFLGRAMPVRDACGEIVKWFGTYTDIEDYKQAEAKIKVLNDGLQERNENLIVQTHRAEEANRAKSAFLATMSHEIRTPMNAILGMSDLLWDSHLDVEQRQYVEVFRRAGNNLLTLINDILDLSKIEAGHFELEKRSFNVEDLADRSIELVGPKANAKGISLMCRIAPDLPVCFIGDPGRLQQILVNLLGNAVKFTEKGEVVLSIQPDTSREPGRLEVSVSDTGIGIPLEKREAIFEDFAQADTSTTRKYGGTGLGLGICQRLVQCMGGRITVESVVGLGSTFRFTAMLEPGVETRPALHDELDLHGRRVLLIDNNATNRLILRETLTAWGMQSAECASAAIGAEKIAEANLANRPFAMVILDVRMPYVDGFEAIPLLRAVSPDVPIVMLTSDDRPGDAAKRRAAGLSGYAVRPVRRADLLRLICDALGTPLKGNPLTSSDTNHGVGSDAAPGVLRVLIAEDSADNRILLQAYLKRSPHILTFVEDGKRAVDQFLMNQFDLILMDMQMPVMDGLESTRAIRRIEKNQGRVPVPIVAITANALTQDAEASENAGCTAHVSKPISKERLLTTIAQFQRKPMPLPLIQPAAARIADELRDLVPEYLAGRKQELPILLQSLQAGKFDHIRKLAHNLKGTGTSFGFPELTKIGGDLELSAKHASVTLLTQQLRELGQYLGDLQIPSRN